MKAVINKKGDAILLQNFNREPERPIYEKIVDEFKKNDRIRIIRVLEGPLEDIVTAECNGSEVYMCYDIDYGLCPIRCRKNNINDILEIVSGITTK